MTAFSRHMAAMEPHRESPVQRETRLARERKLLDEARDEFRNGVVLDEGEVEAWLDSLDSDEDHPLPQPHRVPRHG